MKKTTYINLHWPITSHSFVVRFTTILSLETLVNYPAGLWQRRVLEWWEWELDWGNYPDRPWIDIWWNIVDFWQFGDRVFSLIVNQTGSNHCKQNIVKKWYWSSDSSNVVSVRTKHGFAINNSGFICLVVLKVSNILICLPVYHVSPIEMGWWYMNIYDDSHWVFFADGLKSPPRWCWRTWCYMLGPVAEDYWTPDFVGGGYSQYTYLTDPYCIL